MKKLIISIVLILSITFLAAKTEQLNNFEELMNALKNGEQVRMIVYYGQCQLISDNEVQERSPDAIGGMNIDVFEYFAPLSIGNPEAFVVFSQTKLINLRGYVYNYAKVKVSEDNEVKITAQYVEPDEFEIEMDENFFSVINNGKNDGAVYFYRLK
jgi:hypothetical protein